MTYEDAKASQDLRAAQIRMFKEGTMEARRAFLILQAKIQFKQQLTNLERNGRL